MDSSLSPSPSTSSSSSPPMEICSTNKCQVCFYQPAHGNHFGANTCRACAAFFRRSNVSKNPSSKCRLSNNLCVPNDEGRWFCKKCRMKRCLDLGMTPDNIQYDRDLFSTSEQFLQSRVKRKITDTIPMSMEVCLGQPHFIFLLDRDQVNTQRTWVDMTDLIRNSQKIMFQNPHYVDKNLNQLEKLTLGYQEVRKLQKSEMSEVRVITKEQTCKMWEREFEMAARWLKYCDEFRELSQELQTDFLKCMWSLWSRIERLATTAEMRAKSEIKNRQYVISHDNYIDFNEVKVDLKWMTNCPAEHLAFFFDPLSGWFSESLVDTLIELSPTDIEITYLLFQLCFQMTAQLKGGEVQKLTDKLEDILADNLHQYYISNNIPRYTLRLTKLLNINNQFKRQLFMRKERFAIGVIFDVFKIKFSHPEMFNFSC